MLPNVKGSFLVHRWGWRPFAREIFQKHSPQIRRAPLTMCRLWDTITANLMQPHPREVVHYVASGKDVFGDWLDDLKDRIGRAAIFKRIDRVEDGNLGDHHGVGAGVYELRIHFGPGYRVYYGEDGPKIVLLLCGGDKSTQHADIRKAHELWAEYRRLK